MGRLRRLHVSKFKSVREPVVLELPENAPLVLVGENNSGKSNLIRALDLLLGESWPGSYEPEDHDFHARARSNTPIEIVADLDDVWHQRAGDAYPVARLIWRYPHDDGGQPCRMLLGESTADQYATNAVREQCLCISVGADRRLSYQLSYVSKYTFLAKLMRKFHEGLVSEAGRVEALKQKFEEVKALFAEVETFAAFSDELRRQVEGLSANLEYQLGIDFSAYDPSNYFHALQVYPQQGDEVRTFDELGTGQAQILALAFAYAYARAFHASASGLVVVIEEPEAHLHPLAQRWVSSKIREFAAQGVQIVVTTHSPAFVNVLDLDGVAVVRKDDGATRIVQLSRDQLAEHCRQRGASRATSESVVPFYAAAATEEILSGLFARKVVLVEGPTEALALPILLRLVGFDTTREGVAIIPVHGVGNLAKWWRFFTAYEIPVYVVFDNDANNDDDERRRRDLLNTLEVDSVDADDLVATAEWRIRPDVTVFGMNFEAIMRSHFGEYATVEDEARTQYGLSLDQSKPLVARYAAERLSREGNEDGWARLNSMAEAIRSAG